MASLSDGDHADEVRATIDALQQGIALLPRAQAVGRIDEWHHLLATSGRDDLRQITQGLADLKTHLLSPAPDGDAIGALLARLGTMTVVAARSAERDGVRHAVERLGHLLLHAGHALRGPRPVSSS